VADPDGESPRIILDDVTVPGPSGPVDNSRTCTAHTADMQNYFSSAPRMIDSVLLDTDNRGMPGQNAAACTTAGRCAPGGLSRVIDSGFEQCAGLRLQESGPLAFHCVEVTVPDPTLGSYDAAWFVSVGLDPGRSMKDLLHPVESRFGDISYDILVNGGTTPVALVKASGRGIAPSLTNPVVRIDQLPVWTALNDGTVYAFITATNSSLPSSFTKQVALLQTANGAPLNITGSSGANWSGRVWLELNVLGSNANSFLALTAPGSVISHSAIEGGATANPSGTLRIGTGGVLVRDSRVANALVGVLVSGTGHTITRSHISSMSDAGLAFGGASSSADFAATRVYISGTDNAAIRLDGPDLSTARFVGLTVAFANEGLVTNGNLNDSVIAQAVMAHTTGGGIKVSSGGNLMVLDSVFLDSTNGAPMFAAPNGGGDLHQIRPRGLIGYGTGSQACNDSNAGSSRLFNAACQTTENDPAFSIPVLPGNYADHFAGFISGDADIPPASAIGSGEAFNGAMWTSLLDQSAGSGGYSCVSAPQDCHRFDQRLQIADSELREALMLEIDEDHVSPLAQVTDFPADDPIVFERGLIEVIDDVVGNNDGLCEPGERCVLAPHMGAWQGEDDNYTLAESTLKPLVRNGNTAADEIITIISHVVP
jgi:hypothetical protein